MPDISFPCAICGAQDPENIMSAGDVCDGCWYGMRLDADAWRAGLRARGIKVEKTGGCHFGDGLIFCTNPYSLKKPKGSP